MAEAAPASTPPAKSYSSDPALYLYTSLTSGSSHIVTATSRLETILKANRIPFKALDIATDEKARMLWGRRAGKDEGGRVRKIPGLVQMGLVIGDLVEIEDWNEYGELKQHVKIYYDAFTTPAKGTPTPTPNITPAKKPASKASAAPVASTSESSTKPESKSVEPEKKAEVKEEPSGPTGGVPTAFTMAMKQAGEEAAKKVKEGKKKVVKALDGSAEAKPTPTKEEVEAEETKTVTKDVEKPKSEASPVPGLAALSITDYSIHHAVASMQSPTSTSWKTPGIPTSKFGPTGPLNMGSMQSPTSTSWKPADFEPPVTHHRGSEVKEASPEEIKAIEDSLAIKEEDEEDEED